MECNMCEEDIEEKQPYSNFMGIYVHKECQEEFLKEDYPSLYKLINNK